MIDFFQPLMDDERRLMFHEKAIALLVLRLEKRKARNNHWQEKVAGPAFCRCMNPIEQG